MSKYIVMFSEVDGRFYNVCPVAKIDWEYEIPIFRSIWKKESDPEVREEIRDFLPGTDRNVGLIWEKDEYHDIKRTVSDATWAVMDLEKACENSDWVNGHKKLHYSNFDDIFSTCSEEDIYFVDGAENTDGDCMPLYSNDEYLQMDSNGNLTGPYVDKDGTAAATGNCTEWELTAPVTVLECNVRIKDGYAETNNLYKAGFVFKKFIIEKKRLPAKRITEEPAKAEDPVSNEPSETVDLSEPPKEIPVPAAIEEQLKEEAPAAYLLPEDMQWGTCAITTSKASKEFKPTKFKNDIENSGHKNLDIEALKYIFASGALTADLLDILKKQNGLKGRTAGGTALNWLSDKAYLSKINSERFGTLYNISEYGAHAYQSDMDCKLLKVTKGKYDFNGNVVNNAADAVPRFASNKILCNMLSEVNISGSGTSYNGLSFLSVIDEKPLKTRDLVVGSFEYDNTAFEEAISIFCDELEQKTIPGRVFITGWSLAHTVAVQTELEKACDNLPEKIYLYVFEEDKFYTLDGASETNVKDIFAEKITPPSDNGDEPILYEKNRAKKGRLAAEAKEREAIKRQKIAEDRAAELEAKTRDLEEKSGHAWDQYEQTLEDLRKAKVKISNLNDQKQKIIDDARKNLNEPEFARVAVDGYLATQLVEAAARWGAEQEFSNYAQYCDELELIKPAPTTGTLADYLVEKISKVRPSYSRNDILNIAICMTQSLITVFSGTPGSGKTSICNIMGQVLGLDQPVGEHPFTRYVPISVGRGWTSQRDFIGYYNPLTKDFDKSNQKSFDAFMIGDMENTSSKYPICITLDEANLSPMEYYWSEFIRLCDEHRGNPYINCGGKRTFFIPETLRFLATINNDDTTTTLSPRMIDRAWIITLPELTLDDLLEKKSTSFNDDELRRVQWKELTEAFGATAMDADKEKEIVDVLKGIITIDGSISISHRTYQAMIGYCSAAERCFGKEKQDGAKALDYAIAQRILPKINGANSIDSNYGDTLKKLHDYLLDECGFELSASMVSRIKERGDDIGYYQFF